MDKIKVLMVLGSTGMGGAQAFVLNLIRNLDLSRFQVDLAVDNIKKDGIAEDVQALGCNIFILPYFKVYNYRQYVSRWKSFLEEHHYDIIHAHSTNSASVYLKIAKAMGCSTIAHSHSAGYRGNVIQKFAKRYFASKVGKFSDYWFACSEKAAQRLFGDAYKNYRNYYEIPNAINADNYLYDIEKAKEIRRFLGVSEDEFLCGHVGTFSEPKNHSFLLDIFYEILKLKPKAKLVCCGVGALMPQVKEKAAAMGIIDKIIFPGVVKNCNEYLMAMDVFVFPSIFEGLPVSVVEAEATGLPVVMSDIITKEVDLSDCVYRHSLRETAAVWAKTICAIDQHDRMSYNKIVEDSKFNMKKSILVISSLYEKLSSVNKRMK